ncbi:DUF883 family protein [Undibacterium pigrum]|uniref:ElaB/YqjD/DUF883 family membrane-anchored ribosome-binding protein n=1 Tax=Undibacterium pigrum TaxID=401470 RepID=A0A318JH14_9BURK|nr:DUF883 family protein [Undibacterium pigrum]PXX43028.1 ElaB/YqjD/DUF883 family membrane-anchored ribosome-binding protein [Undibacterium pigrum]
MQSNTIATKTNSALEAANNLASHVGSSVGNVIGVTKEAGKQISSAAQDEIQNLKADLDELVARIPSLSDVDLNAAKAALLEKFVNARDAALDATADVRTQINDGVDTVGNYVKERPLQSVAAVAGVGILIGYLLAKK